MSQYLNEVLEELSRFSPNARVENPVIVFGISPDTQVTIEAEDSSEVKELREENERLEKECDGYEKENDEMKVALRQIREVINENEKDYFQATVDVLRILDGGGYK